MNNLSNDRIQELIEEQRSSLLAEFVDTIQGNKDFNEWFESLVGLQLESVIQQADDMDEKFHQSFKRWALERFRNVEDDREEDSK